MQAFAGDAAGNIWVSEDATLTHVVDQRVVERIPWTRLGSARPAGAMLCDQVGGGLWLGFRDGTGVAHVKGAGSSPQRGQWVGQGDRGVCTSIGRDTVGLNGGRPQPHQERAGSHVERQDGLPCDAVHWAIEDDTRVSCTPPADWRESHDRMWTWAVDVEKDGAATRRVKATVLDHSDGVRVHAMSGNAPQVGKSRDGRIWFLPGWRQRARSGPSAFNALPPPVHVEQITADRQVRPGSRAAAATGRARRFDRFHGAEFRRAREDPVPLYPRGPGSRVERGRQLSAGPLFQPAARPYRFRVANNSDLEREESLQFAIAPAYYETDGSRRSAPQRLWGCSGPRTGCTSGTWCGS